MLYHCKNTIVNSAEQNYVTGSYKYTDEYEARGISPGFRLRDESPLARNAEHFFLIPAEESLGGGSFGLNVIE